MKGGKKMTQCEICGKRMWFWQELIMTTNEFGDVVIPIAHDKCNKGQIYIAKLK